MSGDPGMFLRKGGKNTQKNCTKKDLHYPGIKPRFPALQADSILSEPPGTTYITASEKLGASLLIVLHNILILAKNRQLKH